MQLLHLVTRDLCMLVGCLLTGHADLNQHLTLMEVKSDPMCAFVKSKKWLLFISLGWAAHLHWQYLVDLLF